jgi:hypothetical protein
MRIAGNRLCLSPYSALNKDFGWWTHNLKSLLLKSKRKHCPERTGCSHPDPRIPVCPGYVGWGTRSLPPSQAMGHWLTHPPLWFTNLIFSIPRSFTWGRGRRPGESCWSNNLCRDSREGRVRTTSLEPGGQGEDQELVGTEKRHPTQLQLYLQTQPHLAWRSQVIPPSRTSPGKGQPAHHCLISPPTLTQPHHTGVYLGCGLATWHCVAWRKSKSRITKLLGNHSGIETSQPLVFIGITHTHKCPLLKMQVSELQLD